MGGNAFMNVKPVSLEHLQIIWPKILKTLKQFDCSNIIPIGTTFQKDVMGDIDIAVKHYSKERLYQSLIKHFDRKNVCLIGGSTISIVYDSCQVDITVGNPSYLWWSRCGTQQRDPTMDNFSMFKGTLRQIFFNTILKSISSLLFKTTEVDRECYSLDLDCGLFLTQQTKRGATENTLKKWKSLDRDFLTDDITKICSVIYNGYKLNKIHPECLLSFERAFITFNECNTIQDDTKQIILISFIEDVTQIIQTNCNKISIYTQEQTIKSLNQYVKFSL